MNTEKAWKALSRLIDDGPDDLLKFAVASAILDGLERDVPSRPLADQTRSIIFKTRQWFEHLCGLGGYEAGDNQLRQQFKLHMMTLLNNPANKP